MPWVSAYLYPANDISVAEWTGSPDNITKYTNLDEGISSASDLDNVFKSGSRSSLNQIHSFSFGLGESLISPSSCQLNLRVNASGMDATSAGSLYLQTAKLRNANSEIISRYDRGVGAASYSFVVSNSYSKLEVSLSGNPLQYSSEYLTVTNCDLQFSGDFTNSVPLTDQFKIAISAFEFNVSGFSQVQYSGIPLFLKCHEQFSECFKVIAATGTVETSGKWFNENEQMLENNPTWWTSVGSGVHTPNDITYIKASSSITYLHPVGTSGSLTNWLNEAGLTPPGSPTWINSVNSGVTTPRDPSFIYCTTQSGISPDFLFNKPITANKISPAFRVYNAMTSGLQTISNTRLFNGSNTLLNSWNNAADTIILGNGLSNYYLSGQVTSIGDWTTSNNYLRFTYIASGTSPPGSGVNFKEIDLVTDAGYPTPSPKFYLNEIDFGAITEPSGKMCFRIANSGEAFSANFQVQSTWYKNDGTALLDGTITTKFLANSGFTNYCTAPGAFIGGVYNGPYVSSYIQFNGYFDAQGSNTANQVLFSEIELCLSGLDTWDSGNIPLYIHSPIPSSDFPLFIKAHDTTYVKECLQPFGVSGEIDDGIGTTHEWTNELGYNSNEYSLFYKSVNSGIHTPVDVSWITLSEPVPGNTSNGGPSGLSGFSRSSPAFLISKPTINSTSRIHVSYRTQNLVSGIGHWSINQTSLYNSSGSLINQWNSAVDEIFPYGDGTNFYNYYTSGQVTNYSRWTPTNNYLLFTEYVKSGYLASDTRFSEIEVCISGIDPVHSGDIPLFIEGGWHPGSGDLTLYTAGLIKSSGTLDLYLHSPAPSSTFPLVIFGQAPISGFLPLWVGGAFNSSGNIPLSIHGITSATGSMPLYLLGRTLYNSSGSLNLSLLGSSGNVSLFDDIPLFLKAESISGPNSGYVPLVLRGPPFAQFSGQIPVFLKVRGNQDGSITEDEELPLFLKNAWTALNSGLPLFLQTQSGTMGAIPFNDSIPLYMARQFNSVADIITLFCEGPKSLTEALTLYVSGATTSNNSLSLVLPSSIGRPNSLVTLYSHGF